MKSKRQAHFRHRRAFTLLELLLVLALVAISMAAVVPHLNGTLGQWQLREGARNLETALRLASQWARVKQEACICPRRAQPYVHPETSSGRAARQ